MNDPTSSNRHLRFSIAALLFVTLCVAGALTGYRLGWQAGYAGGQKKKKSEELLITVYDVKDIVLPADSGDAVSTPNYDGLILALTTTVAPDTWVDVGGPGTLKEMPDNLTLVVRQTGAIHEQIEAVLGQMRETRKRSESKLE